MELLGCRWNYINEGNVHIVIELKETDHVLRLIKEDDEPVDLVDVRNSVMFVNVIMAPWILDNSNYYQEVIELPEHAVADLRQVLYHIRPESRRFKSKLSLFAIKTLNLTMLSPQCGTNYCVEIKPKEGFISSSFKSLSKCYYCLKQHLKLDLNQIQKKSNYCPLDLFSGDRKRMKLAIINLINNPQNNFKIFKDGKIIYQDNSEPHIFENVVKSMNVFKNNNIFLDFIIQTLLCCNNQCPTLTETQEITNEAMANGNCLESTYLQQFDNTNPPFLYKLLQVQKLSNKMHIDLKNVEGHGKKYVHDIVDQIQKRNLNLQLEHDRRSFIETAHSVHLALISAVATDCSIMICFSPDYIENHKFIEIESRKIPYSVSVTDLEPKNIESLLKRQKTESRMLDIFKNYYGREITEQDCKIQPHTETRAKQLEAWQQLITEYFKANKLSTLDIREALNYPLFNNAAINRKLSQEALITVLEDMARTGCAAPIDKSKTVWEVYWHSLDEWGNMIYSWASNNGMTNSVCTLFELREGDNTADEEFHHLDMNILTKALRSLEAKGKCELIEFDDNQGVKFF